ncbi:SAM-dependent methyltransferase [Streptomyces sp. V4I23]|uniref:class I SAM-dependent methyltransferase n=1 Tax=Streptomyces sp. V4I23 TaxID=3042282 RepID=UPI002783E249|nr:class I SAM-dependent methyltransferase [Streptomyces sp. V4I23]MDQ1006966.1 SAM-dependent methyltransferase [Streptomyces sp. V4I23]
MREAEIQDFWSAHPCGDQLFGSPSGDQRHNYEEFFSRYDRAKYRLEPHIPLCLNGLDLAGRRVLEIGLGQGAEAELLIRRGARWAGVDLTETAVERTRTRLAVRHLPFDGIHRASALDLPFPADSFDIVFSHGVLHHVPDIHDAQREIHRVLKPGGQLVVMLYARWSLNYLLSIGLLRRVVLLTAHPLSRLGLLGNPRGLLGAHLDNARRYGLLRYLRMGEFIHRNTDGPANPYSRVYDKREVRKAFSEFVVTRTEKRFMHAPPLPVHGLPGEKALGWHLWVYMRPKK